MNCKDIFEDFIKSSEKTFLLFKVKNFKTSSLPYDIKIYTDTKYYTYDINDIECNNFMLKQLKKDAIKSNITINS